jgi:hypothetical protein
MRTSIAEFETWRRTRSRDVHSSQVSARLSFLSKAPARPVSYLFQPPEGVPRDNSDYQPRTVTVRNARVMASSLSVHRNGFELWDAPTGVDDFLDESKVVERYYSEVAALALLATGGTRAHVFDHLVRRREPGEPAMTLGARPGSPYPGPAGRVHNDYSETSGAKRFGLVLEGQSPRGRYCIVNLWRSIGRTPVLDTPLAVCDARSVEPADLVASEIRYPSRSGEIYLVRHNPAHAWAYFSAMQRDEVLVFKQYDSEREGVARFTPHAAFDLADVPTRWPPRQSIEVRCLVTFE